MSMMDKFLTAMKLNGEDDDYYDKFIEEISPRTNYGQT